MWVKGRMIICAALVWVVSGVTSSWAGDGVKLVDRCQTITVGDRSTFVLVKNLFSSGGDCLVINSSDVTLDLQGFTINGSGTGQGITSSTSVYNVTVRNGTVRAFAVGVSLGGSGNVVEDVRIADNTDTGLFVGAGSLAKNLIVQGNFRFGAILSAAGTIKDSIVRANGNSALSTALSAGPGSTVMGNTISSNIGTGLLGSTGGTVIGNTVLDTIGLGISVICPANILQNTATSNTGGNLVLNGIGCNVDNNVAP
jgi:hypothetical protein